MKATIQTHEPDPYGGIGNQNAKNYFGEKEMTGAVSVVALYKGDMREVIAARFWMGRSRSAMTVYCSVWLRGLPDQETGYNTLNAGGTGTAGGGGYHKPSAALSEALESAGVTLDESIAGRGDRACLDALEATARALGFRGKLYTIQHGAM